jgi:hypothetical protein
MEVIEMRSDRRIDRQTTEFPLRDAVADYAKLKAGRSGGHAVLILDAN